MRRGSGTVREIGPGPSPFQVKYPTHLVRTSSMVTFLIWLVLFVVCWPLALMALVLYPLVWLLLLPFRLVGVAVEGVFGLLKAVLFLPVRLLGGPRPARG